MRAALACTYRAHSRHHSRVADKFRKTHEFLLRLIGSPGIERATPLHSATPDEFARVNIKLRTPGRYSRCAPNCLRLPGGRKYQPFFRDGLCPLPKYHGVVKCKCAVPSAQSSGAPLPRERANI